MSHFFISEGFIHEEKLKISIWHDCICTCAVQCVYLLKLSFTASDSATMKPRVSYNSSFCFFKGLFFCVIHFLNSMNYCWQAKSQS